MLIAMIRRYIGKELANEEADSENKEHILRLYATDNNEHEMQQGGCDLIRSTWGGEQ